MSSHSIVHRSGVTSGLRRKLLGLAAIALGSALCGPAAHAAFSGTIKRSVCVNGAGIPKKGDAGFWGQGFNICAAKVTDASSATTYHWTRVSIPIERTTDGTASGRLSAVGGASGNRQVCMKLTTFDEDGNYVDSNNSVCTEGASTLQALLSGPMTIYAKGGVLMDIAAQNAGEVRVASLTTLASGS